MNPVIYMGAISQSFRLFRLMNLFVLTWFLVAHVDGVVEGPVFVGQISFTWVFGGRRGGSRLAECFECLLYDAGCHVCFAAGV